jgi:hypothetical protein
MPDAQRLIGLVAEHDGIRVDKGDPIFALATVCQACLEETSRELDERVALRLGDFEAAVGKVQARAGQLIAAQFNESVAALRSGLESDVTAAGVKALEIVTRIEQANRLPFALPRIAIVFASALALFAAGIVIGAWFPHS